MPTPMPDDTLQNLKIKKQQMSDIQAQSAALQPAEPAPMKPAGPGAKVDRVHPKGAPYGSRPGEKRLDVSGMTKPLGTASYKHGTDYVPKTAPAMLHKGEAVTPAKDNPMNPYSKITEGDKKTPKKSLKSIHTRKAKDNTYIHEHHHHAPHAGMEHMEEHTSPDMAAMKAHMDEHAPNIQATPPDQTGAQAQEQAIGMTQ